MARMAIHRMCFALAGLLVVTASAVAADAKSAGADAREICIGRARLRHRGGALAETLKARRTKCSVDDKRGDFPRDHAFLKRNLHVAADRHLDGSGHSWHQQRDHRSSKAAVEVRRDRAT
jgi:hypothetical protein